ncbi:hypothetical protein M422DRAFT_785173, partial [Sphaerobolus stellatus SS14]
MTTRSQSRCQPPSDPSNSQPFSPILLLRPPNHTIMDDDTENVSYIIIHDLSPEAKMLYLSPSLTEVLGFEPGDVLGTSSFDWMHPDEVEVVKQLHYDTIREDKAAAVAYLRVQNQEDAYVSCVI